MDTLMSRMPDLVGRVFVQCQYFTTRIVWNPHKLQLPDCVFRLFVDEESELFHPDNSVLAILDTVRFLEDVGIRSSPETCRLFTAALMQMYSRGESRLHVLDVSCHQGIIDEQTQNGIIENLQGLIPGLTKSGFMFGCPNFARRVIEEVLPLGNNLTYLKFKCATFDVLQSLLACDVFRVLRELNLIATLSMGYALVDGNMDFLVEAIRSHAALRRIRIEGPIGSVDHRLVEAILANPTIIRIEYKEHTSTMTYFLTQLPPEAVYPRSIECWDAEEHGLLLSFFPRKPSFFGWFNNKGMPGKASEIVSPSDLCEWASALRNPDCTLRNIRAIVSPELEASADGFFAAVTESTSLRSLSLFVQPSAAPGADVLRENLYLKEFEWIGELDIFGGSQQEALIDAAVANETIETYHFLPVNSLWRSVANRNMTLCVKRIRLLWISWAREWAEHGRFEPAVVFETIQMADLGWSEADRVKHQREYELDIPTKVKELKKAYPSPRGGKCCYS